MFPKTYLYKEMTGIGYTPMGRFKDYVVFGRGYERVSFQECHKGLYEFHKLYNADKFIKPTVGLEDCVEQLKQYYGGEQK
jgi:hypothetical protein